MSGNDVWINTTGQQRSILDCFGVFSDEICKTPIPLIPWTSPRLNQWSSGICRRGTSSSWVRGRPRWSSRWWSPSSRPSLPSSLASLSGAEFFFVQPLFLISSEISTSFCLDRIIKLPWIFPSMNICLKGMLPLRIQLTPRTESRMKSWTGSLPSTQVIIAFQLF